MVETHSPASPRIASPMNHGDPMTRHLLLNVDLSQTAAAHPSRCVRCLSESARRDQWRGQPGESAPRLGQSRERLSVGMSETSVQSPGNDKLPVRADGATAIGNKIGLMLVADCCRLRFTLEGAPSPVIQRQVTSRRPAPAQPSVATRAAMAIRLLAIGKQEHVCAEQRQHHKGQAKGTRAVRQCPGSERVMRGQSNLSGVIGAWAGGMTIAAGFGLLSAVWAGFVLTAAGLAVFWLGVNNAPRLPAAA